MNLNKCSEFFDASKVNVPVHIIGVGALGSYLATSLARQGVDNIHIWDFDVVEEVNITNQVYTTKHLHRHKIDAMAEILYDINPALILTVHTKYIDQPLAGYVFMAVDSIKVRQAIVEHNYMNNKVLAVFDTRMELTSAQQYAADWSKEKDKASLAESMNFTDEEATANVPVSACGTTLSVLPTVLNITCITLSNFMNFVLGKPLVKLIIVNPFEYDVLAM